MSEREFKNLLCIRADNMGDVIMSSPAIRALKETFGSRITLLTSKAGSLVVPYLDCIDDVIVSELPWVSCGAVENSALLDLIGVLKDRNFDTAIIFTVYSQSALPAALFAYMAEIPVRAGYARENPYQLLTDWLPDPEPYQHISHQVERDLGLVERLGASVSDNHLKLCISDADRLSVFKKLSFPNNNEIKPYIILHPGVSEAKRAYPAGQWINTGKLIAEKYRWQIFVTGSASEKALAETIAAGIGENAVSVAGMLSLGEFASLIGMANCVVSVNTATIHIAAAMQTPIVVLYGQTNPQHTPWKSVHRILPFSVPDHLQSRNTIIRYVSDQLYTKQIPYPAPGEIISVLDSLIQDGDIHYTFAPDHC